MQRVYFLPQLVLDICSMFKITLFKFLHAFRIFVKELANSVEPLALNNALLLEEPLLLFEEILQ